MCVNTVVNLMSAEMRGVMAGTLRRSYCFFIGAFIGFFIGSFIGS